jgi:amino acid transporter
MSSEPQRLRRELKTWETFALSIAMMSPTLAMAVYGGAPAGFIGRAAPLAFILSGIGVALVGAGLVYLCRYVSHAGSVYGLTGATLGPKPGFFSGWALLGCYLIYTPASAATSGYFATLFLKTTGIWPGADYILFTVIFLIIVFLLASREIKIVGRSLLSIEGLSIAAMLVVLVVVVVKLAGGFHGNHISGQVFVLPSGVNVHELVLASVFGFTAFAGFEGAASLGEETQNPRRSIPKALTIAIVGAVVFYIVCVAIMAMGFGTSASGGKAFASSSGPLFDLSQTYVGRAMADTLELGAMVSAFGAALGSTVGAGRLLFALARDARPRSRLARLDKTGAPVPALVLAVGFALVVNVLLRVSGVTGLNSAFYLGTSGTLSLLVAYAMVDVGAVRLMMKSATVKAVAIIPLLGFALLCYVLFNELYPEPAHPYNLLPYFVGAWLLIGLGVVVLIPGVAQRIGVGLAEAEGIQTHDTRPEIVGGVDA